jgi:aldehyde dehydrogenase (NAD+)
MSSMSEDRPLEGAADAIRSNDRRRSSIPKRKTIPPGRLLIDGCWRDASDGATMATFDPTTEAKITDVAKATATDAGAAVEAASRAVEAGPWGEMDAEERAKILFRMADLLDARAEDFALREAMDMGMPYQDFLTAVLPTCSGMLRFFGGLAMQLDGTYRQSYERDLKIITRREPLGVVAAITPFNFPLTLSLTKIAPALATGNAVVHKPASDTPLTAVAFAQLTLDAGLPPGAYNLVTGPGGSLGDALVKHPRVDKIAFTGSTSVGQEIVRASAATLKRTTMELGGKSPNIIFADANLERAIEAAFWGIFWNKGEVCVAGSRLLVERPVYDQVIGKLATKAKEATLGDPLDPATVIGPMASKAEYDKVMRYIEAGKASSARLVAGGGSRKIQGKGLFIEPTIFVDANNEDKIAREEIFGPVLAVMPFDGEDEAVRLANDTPYGLAAGIQTGDLRRALRLGERIKAGTIWLNTWHKYHPNAPFGGYKMSGYGREQGAEVLESYTQHKTMWANLA